MQFWEKIDSLLLDHYDSKNWRYVCICDCWKIYNSYKYYLLDTKVYHECWTCKLKRDNDSFIWIHWDREILSSAKYIKTKRVIDAKCLLCQKIYKNIWLYWIINRKIWCASCNTKSRAKKFTKSKYQSYIWNNIWNLEILWFGVPKIKQWKNISTFNIKCYCWNKFTSLIHEIITFKKRSCWCKKKQDSPMANRLDDLFSINFKNLILIWEDSEYNKKRNKSIHPKKYLFACKCWGKKNVSATLFDANNWLSCWCIKSQQQTDVREYIYTLTNDFTENDQSLGFEIDFLFKKLWFGIEYNWDFWHSVTKKKEDDEILRWKKWILRKKHYLKKIKSKEKWINLIHIWEDEWINKQDIVKSMIRNRLWLSKKIFARKTKIVEIPFSIYAKFCNENHIQWKSCTCETRLWLEYNWELVSVMWFKNNDLVRFCSRLWNNVIGWFSKLLKYFIKNHPEHNEIISFAAWDIVNIWDNVYDKNWFISVKKPDISYFYIKEIKKKLYRYHKSVFRKEKITKKFWYIFKKWETEYSAMEKLWYMRCYNSWIQKYVLPLLK